jgi:hypothetical protein
MSEDPIGSGTRKPQSRARRPVRGAEAGPPPAPAEDVLRIQYVHDWRGVGAGSADPDGEDSAPRDPTAGPALPHRRPPRVVYVNDWRERDG